MDNKTHFEPDYQKLNRQAKRTAVNGKKIIPDKIFDRIMPGSKKSTAVSYDTALLENLDINITFIKSNIDWDQELQGGTYVVFDTETTGLYPYRGDEIISIGAVIVEKEQVISQPAFYRLVNPGRSIPAQITKLTGIDNEMVNDQPYAIEVIKDFLEFCGPRVLVAHNAPFDLAFLNRQIGEVIGRRVVNPVIDTVLLTSALFYALGDYSLENVARNFKLDLEGRHNALSDARIAASLFIKLLPTLKENGVTRLPHLASLFSDMDLTRGYPLIF